MNVANEIKNGNIDATINTSEHEGEFFVTVQSVNDLINAFVHPLQEAMNIVNNFATGNFTARYDTKAQVKGDFEKFKIALDNSGMSVSDAIIGVKGEVETLQALMEETNASATEVSSTTTMLAQNSSSVSGLAERSSSSITQGTLATWMIFQKLSELLPPLQRSIRKAWRPCSYQKKG